MRKLSSLYCHVGHQPRRWLLLLALVLAKPAAWAQTSQFAAVAATGYTQDVIAEGTGTVASRTTTSFDDETVNPSFVSNLMVLGFNNGSGSTATVGLPTSGQLSSAATSGLVFQLGPYAGNNSLRLSSAATTGTLTLNSTVPAADVRLLVASGGDSNPTPFTATVNFSDGTSQLFTGLASPDWTAGTGTVAASNLGRANRPNNTINNAISIKLYELTLPLSTANLGKQVASVAFARPSTSTADRLNVLALSVRLQLPALTSLSPTYGLAGTSATLTGAGFLSGSTVSFNGTAATSVTVNSSTSITATVPTGATTGNVTVTNSNGTSNGVSFAVAALPILVPTITASGPVTFPSGGSVALTANRNPAALRFNGSSQYVSASLDIRPSTLPTLTMEAWVYPTTATPAEQTVVSADAGGYSRAIVLTGGSFAVGTGLTNFQSVGAAFDLNQWQHVAVVYTPTTVTFYKNGVQTYNGPLSFSNASYAGSFNIGRNPTYGSYFTGYLDEVRVWDRAINVADYVNQAVPAGTPGVVAYWHLDEGTGTATADVTGTYPGTVNGATWVVAPYATAAYAWTPTTGLTPASGTAQTETAAPATTGITTYTLTLTDTQGNTAPAHQNVTVATPGDLVVTTGTAASPTSVAGGIYNSITVMGTGYAQLVGATVVNSFVSVQSGSTLSTNCQSLTGAGSFTLAAGGTLGICDAAGISATGSTGAIQTTGTRTFSTDASYVYNGLQVQSTGPALPTQVRSLTTTNTNALSLSAATSVAQVLTVANRGNLVLGGQALTLLSSASGTALAVNSSTGIVQGTATVQRYIDGSLNAGAGYRHYSAPVSNTTVADLATSSFAPVLTQSYNTSATPATTTPFPNVFGYDQARLASTSNNLGAFDKGFVVPQAADALIPGQGYAVNIGAGELVDFQGTLGNNTLTVSMARNSGSTTADAGWALVGNPYPAPLDWSQVQAFDRTNLDAAIYVVQSTGQYAGGYRAYVNGQSTTGTNNPLLATAQGFFVRVSPGQTSSSLTFRNAQRVTDYTMAQQTSFQRTTTDPRPALRLTLAGAGLADGWVAYAEAGATPSFDAEYDAAKLPNGHGLNLSSAGSTPLAIDARPAFTLATVLPLAVGVPAAGTYTLTVSAIDNLPAGLTAYLHDAHSGQTLALAAGTSYSFAVTSAQAQALLLGRFTVQFAPATPLAATSATLAATVSVHPNPAREQATVTVPGLTGTSAVRVELLNALGQVVLRQQAALPAGGAQVALPTAGLAAGVYVVRLTAGELLVTKRLTLE